MSEQTGVRTGGVSAEATGGTTYDVVLLVEQALSRLDAEQVRSLHDSVEEPVSYHVLLPAEDAADRVASGIGALGTGEMAVSPALTMDEEDLRELQRDSLQRSRSELSRTLEHLRAGGARAEGRVIGDPPVDALAATVSAVGAREAIILTRPHVVAEFFHVDWTSRARRKLGVPVLHLLEHESFDEQAGGGEGVTGL